MKGDVKFLNGQFLVESENGKYAPIQIQKNGGGLSKNSILNLINKYGGLGYSEQATATDDITTSSITDVVATGMTLTPPAGTYLVWFSGSATPTDYVYFSIYSNNIQFASSEKSFSTNGFNIPATFTCIAKVTVDGSQLIEGRWRVNTDGTATMHQRNLTILKVA